MADRFKQKVCFWLTSLMFSIFLYLSLGIITENSRMVRRLQEEVEEIAIAVLKKETSNASAKVPYIENMLKNSLVNIVEDLQSVKRRLDRRCAGQQDLAQQCANCAVGARMEDRINYASSELGAKVDYVYATPIDGYNIFKKLLGLEYSSNPPVNMLNSNMLPGTCFGFRGNESEVIVKLGRAIFIDVIELEHISKNLSPTGETLSAPKSFEVLGMEDAKKSGVLLGVFTFDNDQTQLRQSFPVNSLSKYGYIRIKFLTNHGHPIYTCIYRIGVYGTLKR